MWLASDRRDGARLPGPVPSPPPSVQTLLLIAAADDSGQVATFRRAAGRLGVDAGALDDAERSGPVVVAAGQLRVRHPLARRSTRRPRAANDAGSTGPWPTSSTP